MDIKSFVEICALFDDGYFNKIDDVISYLINKYHCVTKQDYEIIKEFFI